MPAWLVTWTDGVTYGGERNGLWVTRREAGLSWRPVGPKTIILWSETMEEGLRKLQEWKSYVPLNSIPGMPIYLNEVLLEEGEFGERS